MSQECKMFVKKVGNGLVVQGNAYPYRDSLKQLGGQWNANLRVGDTTTKGWVFPMIKLDEINDFIKKVSEGKVKPLESSPPQTFSVSQKDFLSLVSRVERLEEELAHLKQSSQKPSRASVSQPVVELVFEDDAPAPPTTTKKSSKPVVVSQEKDTDDDEEREEKPKCVQRLLHRKK